MPTNDRAVSAAERMLLALLLVWLAWLPLPFASVVPRARALLILPPLALCAMTATVRFVATRHRLQVTKTRGWRIATIGGALLLAVVLLQLLPLPMPLLRIVSPESARIWTDATELARLAGVTTSSFHPITVNPPATTLEFFRLLGIYAAFQTAALLARTHWRRLALAAVLSAAALFEVLYGLREATLGRHAIWGWVNKKVLDRTSGTFVNPNHFAHYLAVIVPLALWMMAVAWHVTRVRKGTLKQHLVVLFERALPLFGYGALTFVACVAGILLAASRGGLVALAAGLLIAAGLAARRRPARFALAAGGMLVVVVALIVIIGRERTIARFRPNEFEQSTFVGRSIGISAAARLWTRFPVLGSGAGTFADVVSLEQREDLQKLYDHAHDDYAELLATTGILGFLAGVVTLGALYIAIVRLTFGAAAAELSWKRRAFQCAALASLSIAMVHALIDFNFHIPSNPPQLAAIVGAAVAAVTHDRRHPVK